ncbi:MAG: 2-oxoacid:acceptor oxidoreductase family protein [Chloroflexota bacterium]|nr:2-oxoacid:acceptor oxidoreductase family protein [Chloroflexota bacterium]
MEHWKNEFRVIFSGLGGHGALTFGQFLAEAAATKYKNVSLMPYYATAMRGGESESTVTASNEEIDSPITYEMEMAIVTSPTMFWVIEKRMKPGGTLVVDDSVIRDKVERQDLNVFYVPGSRIATQEIGEPLTANLVLMGAYLEVTKILPFELVQETMDKSLKGTSKERFLETNKKALCKGREFIQRHQ